MSNIEICPHCQAKIIKYTHSLRSGTLVMIFVKFVKLLLDKTWGEANPAKHGFTTNEYNNFQKLRYWNLIEKGKESGNWKITDQGWDFFFEENSIPIEAITYRGNVQGYSEEKTIMSVLNCFLPYFTKEDYLKFAESNADSHRLQQVLF